MKTNNVHIWIKWNTKNTSNLEDSADMLELSEEEEVSCSGEQKHPRGSQMCLTLTSCISWHFHHFYYSNILRTQLMRIILPGTYTHPTSSYHQRTNIRWPYSLKYYRGNVLIVYQISCFHHKGTILLYYVPYLQ